MTDFRDWLQKAVHPDFPLPKEGPVFVRDLANLAAQLEEALEKIRSGEIPEAVKRKGLFACLTYKETIAALALRHPREFMEKYQPDRTA